MMLDELWYEARRYVSTWQSIDQCDNDRMMILKIRRYREQLAEAIVVMHIVPKISQDQLSMLLGVPLDGGLMEVLAGFYIRHIMNDGKKVGNEILSPRQLNRRRSEEPIGYWDSINYGESGKRDGEFIQ